MNYLVTEESIFSKKELIENQIFLFAEVVNGELESSVFELIAIGKELSVESGYELCIIVIGENLYRMGRELVYYGLDKIYLIEHELLNYKSETIYSDIICEILGSCKPSIMLFAATFFGKSLAPCVSTRLKTGLTANCLNLSIKQGVLVCTRPAFEGNIMANIICEKARPQMATVQLGTRESANKEKTERGEIICLDFKMHYSNQIEIISQTPKNSNRYNLNEAEVVVGLGRGIKRKEELELAVEFAACIHATICVTRPLVECGWFDEKYLIGQSGCSINPRLYIACGISGAIQHIMGCLDANTIICINKDEKAPIFQYADIGIVGDVVICIKSLMEHFYKEEV